MQLSAKGGEMDEMDSLIAILSDPRRLAELGPTEEEVLADLTWPAGGTE